MVPLSGGRFSVRSEVHQETFHPQVGAQEEARCVYFRPMHLRQRLLNATEALCVWDVGLGGAGNALNLIRDHQDLNARVELHSFERCLKPLEFALHHAAKLDYLHGFESFLDQLIKAQRVTFKSGQLELDWHLHMCDLRDGYGPLSGKLRSADAIMYDPYSPAKNPELWSLPAFNRLREALTTPATLATYSRSTSVRVGLLLAGFYVGRGGEVGEKEETTVAATDPGLVGPLLEEQWLKKIRNSTNGEPIRQVPHTRSFLTAETWDRLLRHPQFSSLAVDLELPVRH
jgi:hypothetical protein